MADFTYEEVVLRKHRWIVPAAEPWGAPAAEIGKAWTVAERAYREHHGIPNDKPISDRALHFHVTDDQIVITFEYEEPPK